VPPSEGVTLPPSPAASGPAEPDGLSIPGYEILSTLGRGGMGVVYEARQTKLGRIVALKMILSGAHAGEADLARFRTEAEAIARLQHPNIVQIHEVGEQDGLPFFSLEFCGGGSLEKKLAGTPLLPKDAAALVETLARAMQAAHEKGVIHRDLKPANVLLADDGTPKITDFGLAKKLDEAGQTASGAIMGTPSYMAPEQAGNKSGSVGPLADVYALGAILYECLTGRPPFKAASALDTVLQVVSDEPVPPTQLQSKTPRDLETICLKCLQKEPAKRYASAIALAEELRRYQNGEPIAARPAGVVERSRKWAKRHPATAALLVVSVFAGLTVVGVVSTAAAMILARNRELTAERDRAKTAEEKAIAKETEALAAKTDLEKSNEELETTLARSLLRPLAMQGVNQAVTESEWEALAELARRRHRGRLGYRFVEEASRTLASSQQLRDRAALALAVAVGLDEQRRAEVETLLMARLDDSATGVEQKRNLALAASAWDGLSSSAVPRTALQLGRALTDAKVTDGTNQFLMAQLERDLSAVAARLDDQGAVEIANALVQTLRESKEPYNLWQKLRRPFSEVALRLRGQGAAQVATTLVEAILHAEDPNALSALTDGLAAVAERLEARDAVPRARTLVQVFTDRKGLSIYAWSDLARGLSAMAKRLDAEGADQLTTTALAVLKDIPDQNALHSLAESLAVAAERLEARDAAPAARTLVTIIASTDKGAYSLQSLAKVLSAVAARLETRVAATTTTLAAHTLLRIIKDPRAPNDLVWLAVGLAALAAHMDVGEAANTTAQAAPFLVQAMKDPKNMGQLGWLAQGLSALAARMEAGAAAEFTAQVAPLLVQAMKDNNKNIGVLSSLAAVLSVLTVHMDASKAATFSAQAAGVLVPLIKETRNRSALQELAGGLWRLAPRLESKDAAQFAATLLPFMNDTAERGYSEHVLAPALSALAARLEAPDAVQVITTFLQSMPDSKNLFAFSGITTSLSAVAARMNARDLVRILKDTRHRAAFSALQPALPTVADRLEAREAKQIATTLLQIIRDTREFNVFQFLEAGLSAVTARMDASDLALVLKDIQDPRVFNLLAAALSRAAARMEAGALLQVMKEPKNPTALGYLAHGLRQGLARLEAKDAADKSAQAANILTRILTRAVEEPGNGVILQSLAEGLSAVAPHLEARDAAQVADTITRITTKDPYHVRTLAPCLAVVATRLEARDAAQAAAVLLPIFQDPVVSKDPYMPLALAESLSALASRMPAQDAATVSAQAVTLLTRAIKDNQQPFALSALAQGLSALALHMDATKASNAHAQAASILARVMKDPKNAHDLWQLAQGLSQVAARLPPRDAAQAAAPLIQAIKDTKDDNTSRALAYLLSALGVRMEARDAAQVAITLLQVRRADPSTLSFMLSAIPPAELSSRFATVASAVALPTGNGHPLILLALSRPATVPLPCRLSDQQLVDLLKMPTCIGEVRRIILDHLGNRHQRRFADVWEFVRFAKENLPDIDLISPPQRPEPTASAR
jgi:hypothetical protein